MTNLHFIVATNSLSTPFIELKQRSYLRNVKRTGRHRVAVSNAFIKVSIPVGNFILVSVLVRIDAEACS